MRAKISTPAPHKPSPGLHSIAPPPPMVDVKALVGDGREAVLLHKGDRYRLRITANDKLILTK